MKFHRLLPIASLALLAAVPASAATTAASADDICSPSEDPCVIDEVYDVTGPLAFGSRTVSIVPGGRLRGQPGISLGAGRIEVLVGLASDATLDAANGGGVSLGASRSCSGDLSRLCMLDEQCASVGAGTCTAGNTGTLWIDGGIDASGDYGNGVNVDAAGDIALLRRVNANATVIGNTPGEITIESYQGSVTIDGLTTATTTLGSSYDYGAAEGGSLLVTAAVDVTIAGTVRTSGAGGGGSMEIVAGRDLILNSDLVNSAGEGDYSHGGRVNLASGRDIQVARVTGGDDVQEIATDGGGTFRFYGYGSEGRWTSGYGGYQYLRAGEDVLLGPNSHLHSQGGPGGPGGYINVYAYDGEVVIEGQVRAQGTPPIRGGDSSSGGGNVLIDVSEGVTLTNSGVIDLSSLFGTGSVSIGGSGPVELDGTIDVRGTATGEYNYAFPGDVRVVGDIDLTVGGRIRGGGNDFKNEDWNIDVCRVHLEPTAILDQALDAPNSLAGGIRLIVNESMVAEKGSRIETDATASSGTIISHRVGKPPVLEGTITPAPTIDASGSLFSEVDPQACAVCGNLEIDFDESCDDGNSVGGDGCSADCQDEGCVADTPGYPAVALCDDGIACTKNLCDPVGHTCQNPASCDDGLDCTTDSCGPGGCIHTPVDGLCGDRNPCTTDICNAATGCVHADISGGACEDGDVCTAAGTCDDGTCVVANATVTTPNALKAVVPPGASNDRLKATLQLTPIDFDADPVSTGARLVLTDEDDVVILDEDLPAAGWRAIDGGARGYRYRTPRDSSAGPVSKVSIVFDNGDDVLRAVIRVRGADTPTSSSQEQLSLSLQVGDGSETCFTARRVPCTPSRTRNTCQN